MVWYGICWYNCNKNTQTYRHFLYFIIVVLKNKIILGFWILKILNCLKINNNSTCTFTNIIPRRLIKCPCKVGTQYSHLEGIINNNILYTLALSSIRTTLQYQILTKCRLPLTCIVCKEEYLGNCISRWKRTFPLNFVHQDINSCKQ